MTQISIKDATPDTIQRAAGIIRAGGLVAFPTETVYGLGADATNPVAVTKIFATKRRPQFNPLIVHTSDHPAAAKLGVFSVLANRLADAFWPGALTLVIGCNDRVKEEFHEGVFGPHGSLAVRVSSHAGARRLAGRA